MADGAITLTLDDKTVRRHDDAARRAGVTPEAYALDLIAGMLDQADRSDRSGTAGRHQREQARVALAEYDRAGVTTPLEDVLAEARADLEKRLASRT